MKKRRTLALLGAGVLLLAGCGSTRSTTAAASTATKAAEASTGRSEALVRSFDL